MYALPQNVKIIFVNNLDSEPPLPYFHHAKISQLWKANEVEQICFFKGIMGPVIGQIKCVFFSTHSHRSLIYLPVLQVLISGQNVSQSSKPTQMCTAIVRQNKMAPFPFLATCDNMSTKLQTSMLKKCIEGLMIPSPIHSVS